MEVLVSIPENLLLDIFWIFIVVVSNIKVVIHPVERIEIVLENNMV